MSTYVALKKRQEIRNPMRKSVNTQPAKAIIYRPMGRRSLINPRTGPIQPELKNVDVAGSIGVLVGVQWSELDLLNPLASGSNSSQRIGRRVQLKSLLFRWNASSFTSTSAIRILIVYDRDTNGAIPTITDVLSLENFNAPNNLSEGSRFVVLVDEIHELVTPQGFARAGKIFKKINLPMTFNNSAQGDITSIEEGAIYAMVATPFGGVQNQTNGIGYYSRIRYTDV